MAIAKRKKYSIDTPEISTVTKDLRGKAILVYGSNSLGKTKQATRACKPYYLPFEAGINAISGVNFLPLHNKWSNFKKINKQLTDPRKLEKNKEKYQTIIFDTVFAASMMCQDYLCQKNGVEDISKGNKGYGLWKDYQTEFWKEINKLTNSGYTVYFISHEGQRTFTDEEGEDYTKIFPTGDTRSIDPIIDLCDIVLYLKPNGLDKSGQEKLSSAFMVNTKEYLARSRFDYMQTKLEEFTIENLEEAIRLAVEKEEEVNGKQAVTTFEEQKVELIEEEMPFDELVAEIKRYATMLFKLDRFEEYTDITNEYLGDGKGVGEAKETQKQQLEMILFDLEDEYEDTLEGYEYNLEDADDENEDEDDDEE